MALDASILPIPSAFRTAIGISEIRLLVFPGGTKWAKIKPAAACEVAIAGGLTDGATSPDPLFDATKIDIAAGVWWSVPVGGQGAKDSALPDLNGLPYVYFFPSSVPMALDILFG